MNAKILFALFTLLLTCYANSSNAQTGNTKFGFGALTWNTNGNANSACGYYALNYNKSGSYNTAIGYKSLSLNNSNGNTASGFEALRDNTTGLNNSACGANALRSNKKGGNNTAVGLSALYTNNDGNDNTAVGVDAMFYNTGSGNTTGGVSSLYNNKEGVYNTALGVSALYSNVNGSLNTALGYFADVGAGYLTNATAIGSYAKVARSDAVAVGSSNVVSIGGAVGWSVFSDGRYNKNIKENVAGLTFINSLRPVTYTVNVKGLNEYYNGGTKLPEERIDERTKALTNEFAERAGEIIYNGFIAQEVAAAAKKLNYEFSGVDAPENEESLFALRYGTFVVPLVKAVQELSQQNDELKKECDPKIHALQKQINELKRALPSGEKTNCATENKNDVTRSDALLEQNIRNLFNHTTIIKNTSPQTYTAARIILADKSSKTLKEKNVSGSGKSGLSIAPEGNTQWGSGALASNTAGWYNTAFGYYSLNSNKIPSYNTAMGNRSLSSNDGDGSNLEDGYSNTAFGFEALRFNTIGFYNTAFGGNALRNNGNDIPYENTAVGLSALYNNVGSSNTAIGVNAMFSNTNLYTGIYNTAIGAASLYKSTGGYNTALGVAALYSNVDGSRNTALGYFADVGAGYLFNATAIGYGAVVGQSNAVAIGNSSVVSIGGVVDWSVFSDGRYKKNIKENVTGLAFINILRPVTYTINVKGLNDYYNRGRKLPEEKIKAYTDESAARAGEITYSGFIAQEVEAAAKKLNYEFSGVDEPENEEGLYALRYSNFVVPLVKAMQELSLQSYELKKEYDPKIDALQKQVNELKRVLLSGSKTSSTAEK